MKRPLVIDWFVVLGFIALFALVLPSSAPAIKKHPQTCADELEETKTQLRLRTAELRVAHGQLDAAWKKLKACGVSAEE